MQRSALCSAALVVDTVLPAGVHELRLPVLAGDVHFAGCIALQGPGNTCTRCVGKCGKMWDSKPLPCQKDSAEGQTAAST